MAWLSPSWLWSSVDRVTADAAVAFLCAGCGVGGAAAVAALLPGDESPVADAAPGRRTGATKCPTVSAAAGIVEPLEQAPVEPVDEGTTHSQVIPNFRVIRQGKLHGSAGRTELGDRIARRLRPVGTELNAGWPVAECSAVRLALLEP